MSTGTISKVDFNAAVQTAIAAVQPLLLAAEAAAASIPSSDSATLDTRIALSDLHTELVNQLAIADALGDSGGAHTNSGGTGKGGGDTGGD